MQYGLQSYVVIPSPAVHKIRESLTELLLLPYAKPETRERVRQLAREINEILTQVVKDERRA